MGLHGDDPLIVTLLLPSFALTGVSLCGTTQNDIKVDSSKKSQLFLNALSGCYTVPSLLSTHSAGAFKEYGSCCSGSGWSEPATSAPE